MSNGYDPSNQYPTDQSSYSNSTATNYQNTLTGIDTSVISSMLNLFLVDTNMHYQTQAPSNYYQPPPQQQQQQQPTVPSQTYYPTDAQQQQQQQWSQHQTQTDLLNTPSQLPSMNNSYIQSAADQSSYLQPGFTSTPNSHAVQQQQQQQPWYPSGQNDQRDRLPSNEVCRTYSPKG